MLDQLDMPFIDLLEAEWLEAPPLRFTMAASIGYEKPEPKQYMTAESARAMQERYKGQIPGVPPIGMGR